VQGKCPMSDMQLNMAMEPGKNYFKDALDSGKFIFLAECHVPVMESRCEAAVERIMPLAQMMADQQDLCGGLALTDRRDAPWSAVEISAALPEKLRQRNICFVSGDGRNAEAVKNQFTLAANSRSLNVVPVSGNAAPMTVKECRNRAYCGSVEQLKLLREGYDELFPGTVINPYHYDSCTALATYGALNEKIASGAQFVISQSGWDMLQNQTLAWYLLRQKQFLPLIAHLTWLTADRVEKIIAGEYPGLRMTAAFRKLLSRELLGSKAQFDAAQYRRMELQVAGCRLMGYSGVIISGVDVPARAAMLASRIRTALREFNSFEHWLSEYREHQASAEMGFGSRAFHLFDRVLRRQYPFDEPPEITEPEVPEFSIREKAAYKLKRFFFAHADRERPERDRLLKKLLANCRSCKQCTLPQHHFFCVKNCPKRLEHGPCGGVKEDGSCEIGTGECVFVQIMRCERALMAQNSLES